MKIVIDQHSGCCNGVRRAIEQAEKVLQEKGSLYCLGAIVHNDTEISRLSEKGMSIINYKHLENLSNDTVLFRAHGEPPAVYKMAQQNNLTIIDCTCPVVLQLQKKIAATYKSIAPSGGKIIIFGKNGHAEVNGLIGQVNGDAIVIENSSDIKEVLASGALDLTRPVALFSQTTKDPGEYEEIGQIIKKAIEGECGTSAHFSVFNTICKQVSSRHPNLTEFAQGHSVIIFVSGKESSNGKILFQLCKKVNNRTYSIEHLNEIDPKWFKQDDSVGICGATSTPKWQLEEVANYLNTL